MPCDTKARAGQTLDQRKTEVRTAIARLASALAAGKVQAVVDRRTGAVAFRDWAEGQSARVTDACAYRMIASTGSAAARAAIVRAETLAGRTVSREALHVGVHSHDGGHSFHHGH